MNKNIKMFNIVSFTFLLALSTGLLNAEQVDISETEMLRESYLQGNRDEKGQQCSEEVATALGRKCSFCHNDEVTDFTKKGNKAKFMMRNAIALGVKCKYCHAGKKQFTAKLEVAAKMLKLADMMDVKCNYCHAGKDNAGDINLTDKGKTAKTAMILQNWAKAGNKKCLKCHDKKTQFKLNAQGEKILNSQKGLLAE